MCVVRGQAPAFLGVYQGPCVLGRAPSSVWIAKFRYFGGLLSVVLVGRRGCPSNLGLSTVFQDKDFPLSVSFLLHYLTLLTSLLPFPPEDRHFWRLLFHSVHSLKSFPCSSWSDLPEPLCKPFVRRRGGAVSLAVVLGQPKALDQLSTLFPVALLGTQSLLQSRLGWRRRDTRLRRSCRRIVKEKTARPK